MKTEVFNNLEFGYLKWLLNNLNYVINLKLNLSSTTSVSKANQSIWKSVIDANFILKYCLPDEIINLKYFDFYICKSCNISKNDMKQAINSFKIHKFFIDHQWTNVDGFYDERLSYEHIFSYNPNNFQYSVNLV